MDDHTLQETALESDLALNEITPLEQAKRALKESPVKAWKEQVQKYREFLETKEPVTLNALRNIVEYESFAPSDDSVIGTINKYASISDELLWLPKKLLREHYLTQAAARVYNCNGTASDHERMLFAAFNEQGGRKQLGWSGNLTDTFKKNKELLGGINPKELAKWFAKHYELYSQRTQGNEINNLNNTIEDLRNKTEAKYGGCLDIADGIRQGLDTVEKGLNETENFLKLNYDKSRILNECETRFNRKFTLAEEFSPSPSDKELPLIYFLKDEQGNPAVFADIKTFDTLLEKLDNYCEGSYIDDLVEVMHDNYNNGKNISINKPKKTLRERISNLTKKKKSKSPAREITDHQKEIASVLRTSAFVDYFQKNGWSDIIKTEDDFWQVLSMAKEFDAGKSIHSLLNAPSNAACNLTTSVLCNDNADYASLRNYFQNLSVTDSNELAISNNSVMQNSIDAQKKVLAKLNKSEDFKNAIFHMIQPKLKDFYDTYKQLAEKNGAPTTLQNILERDKFLLLAEVEIGKEIDSLLGRLSANERIREQGILTNGLQSGSYDVLYDHYDFMQKHVARELKRKQKESETRKELEQNNPHQVFLNNVEYIMTLMPVKRIFNNIRNIAKGNNGFDTSDGSHTLADILKEKLFQSHLQKAEAVDLTYANNCKAVYKALKPKVKALADVQEKRYSIAGIKDFMEYRKLYHDIKSEKYDSPFILCERSSDKENSRTSCDSTKCSHSKTPNVFCKSLPAKNDFERQAKEQLQAGAASLVNAYNTGRMYSRNAAGKQPEWAMLYAGSAEEAPELVLGNSTKPENDIIINSNLPSGKYIKTVIDLAKRF